MSEIPEAVIRAWDNHVGAVIFTTVDGHNVPNSIYATCVSRQGDRHFIIADNYFDKTRANIKTGSRAALLFITEDNKAYQIKGRIEYHVTGPFFEDMKRWNPEKHPGHAAAVVVAEEIYSGAEKLC